MKRTRPVGDMSVYPIALGGASWSFRELKPSDRARLDRLAVSAIHHALDSDLNLIDTARAYTTSDQPGHGESLIAEALASYRGAGRAFIATKAGHTRHGSRFGFDVRPEAIRRDCEASLRLLKVDVIDLLQLHWPSRSGIRVSEDGWLPIPHGEIPMATTLGGFERLRDEGLVRNIGVCNVSLQQLREAVSVSMIASVQNPLSPFDSDYHAILEFCQQRSIAFLAYSPLGGATRATNLGRAFPRAGALALRKGISVQRLALAWLLRLSPGLIPICGASRPETVEDCVRAVDVTLSGDDLAEVDFGRPLIANPGERIE